MWLFFPVIISVINSLILNVLNFHFLRIVIPISKNKNFSKNEIHGRRKKNFLTYKVEKYMFVISNCDKRKSDKWSEEIECWENFEFIF